MKAAPLSADPRPALMNGTQQGLATTPVLAHVAPDLARRSRD